MWWPEGQAGTTKSTFSGAGFLFSEREEMLAFLIQCYLPTTARISNLQRVYDQYGDLGKMLVTLVIYHSARIKVYFHCLGGARCSCVGNARTQGKLVS